MHGGRVPDRRAAGWRATERWACRLTGLARRWPQGPRSSWFQKPSGPRPDRSHRHRQLGAAGPSSEPYGTTVINSNAKRPRSLYSTVRYGGTVQTATYVGLATDDRATAVRVWRARYGVLVLDYQGKLPAWDSLPAWGVGRATCPFPDLSRVLQLSIWPSRNYPSMPHLFPATQVQGCPWRPPGQWFRLASDVPVAIEARGSVTVCSRSLCYEAGVSQANSASAGYPEADMALENLCVSSAGVSSLGGLQSSH